VGEEVSLAGFRASNHPQQIAVRGATSRDDLGTDPALFAKLDERFHFTLDVAATADNAKCEQFFTLEDDGLSKWWTGRVWCNPPYSQISLWVQKAWLDWQTVPPPELIVMLLPANRPEQGWWQDHVEPFRDRPGSPLRTEFLRGRQRFVMPGAEAIGPNERPPFGCVLLIWEAA
jgi:phage N-6-adenine-methyltransferase